MKIGASIHSMKFLSPDVAWYLHKSTIQPMNLPSVISGLVPAATTLKCQISFKNGYAGLLALQLLPIFHPCLILFSTAITLLDIHLNQFNLSHLLILEGDLLLILIDCVFFLSPFLHFIRMSMTVSFLAKLDFGIFCLQNAFL